MRSEAETIERMPQSRGRSRADVSVRRGALRVAMLCLCLLAVPAAPAADGARMYQWRDPATGTVQLSGEAPSWYRAAEPGPRVLVFAKGRIVDDTARPVSEAERLALRAEAFGTSEPLRVAEPIAPEPAPSTPVITPPPSAPAAITADDIAHYKAVIEAWDRAERERAAAALGYPPPADAAIPPPAAPAPAAQ